MTSRISTVHLDAVDADASASFWQQALDWDLTVEDGLYSLTAKDGTGLDLDIMAVPEGKTVKNRLHLDLVADGCTQEEEVERLIALGARRVDVGQEPGVTWVVMADPEGNEFCVLG
ncbi:MULTISPECIES: VOC family protein [unclassified Arthrobacter]|uniref:VOC family protein n=1 Tax=unclassified Arthrobacter TaxID=235627 RepID=UPI001D154C57|nr:MULTISPECIES: VOC family protein [unclassified Arthrobacter]MCC3274646.1 VOC family protein [Arthrobacter sp. zg-Y20]MCC9177764.1 VOC family protein [Arthrobacter sp. zg-Y750]MDK1314803.1 VOC family protein [Arthrobacter sp. zg.Y20]WIB04667.1 VOC family protein [Arthrobacter sp. zg-Y20]